jgi:FMN phosphatase YigB (HAD superfamily)
MIKAVSFDFWNTFAIPNPEYAKARNEYLESNYGITKDDYKAVKNHLDYYAETNGLATTPLMAISMLFPFGKFEEIDLNEVYNDFLRMFNENPPTISNEVKESLLILDSKNMDWVITSNTNFIGGAHLARFIGRALGDEYKVHWCGGTFSDVVGCSKPRPTIFETSRRRVRTSTLHTEMKPSSILHIGDNFECDYVGAKKYGFRSALIETPQDILNTIKEINND